MVIFNQPDSVKRLLSVLFSIAFSFSPIAAILLSPIYLFRFILPYFLPWCRPNLHKLIPTRSISMVLDDPNDKPKWNLCVWLTIQTPHFSLDGFREFFMKNIINKRDKNGELMDPEYQQFYTKWLGFYFWEWDRQFDINWHIRKHFPSDYVTDGVTGRRKLRITTETDLKEVLKTLTWRPFAAGKSPWEFLLIPNYKDDGDNNNSSGGDGGPTSKVVVIFHLHHGLCDGTKIIKLLFHELNGGDLTRTAKPHVTTTSRISDTIKNALLSPILAPYQLMQMILQSGDENAWHKTAEENLTYPFNMSITKRIPTSLFHEVKTVHGITFSAVSMAAIAGGIRRSLNRRGLPIPKHLNAVVPMYAPGHPCKLQNHFVIAFIPLPIGESHPLRRLERMEETLQAYKTSFIPQLIYNLIPFMSGLFYWMVKPIYANNMSTFLLSNFPGPSVPTPWLADGSSRGKIIDVNFSGGIGPGKQGLAISMLSYNGGIRIITQADKTILPNDTAVDELNNDIIQELHAFRKAKSLAQ